MPPPIFHSFSFFYLCLSLSYCKCPPQYLFPWTLGAFRAPENHPSLWCSGANLSPPFFPLYLFSLHQVSCVINNFQPTQIAMPTPSPPQRAEPPMGLPLLTLPRVESPLEKLSGLQVRDGGNHYGRKTISRLHKVSVMYLFLTERCLLVRQTLTGYPHRPQRMNLNHFGDLLTFPLAPP